MTMTYEWQSGWVVVDYGGEWLYLASLMVYCGCTIVSVDESTSTITLDAPSDIDDLIIEHHDQLVVPPAAAA
jgi:hypothetical protein